jgi:hypothetical protein
MSSSPSSSFVANDDPSPDGGRVDVIDGDVDDDDDVDGNEDDDDGGRVVAGGVESHLWKRCGRLCRRDDDAVVVVVVKKHVADFADIIIAGATKAAMVHRFTVMVQIYNDHDWTVNLLFLRRDKKEARSAKT